MPTLGAHIFRSQSLHRTTPPRLTTKKDEPNKDNHNHPFGQARFVSDIQCGAVTVGSSIEQIVSGAWGCVPPQVSRGHGRWGATTDDVVLV